MMGIAPFEHNTQYSAILRLRGLRATENRMSMLAMLDQRDNKPTIIGLLHQLQELDPQLGHAAVYHSVAELITAGLIRPVLIMGRTHLDGWQEPHHNLICRGCGKVDSIPYEDLPTAHIWPSVKAQGYHIKNQGLDIEVVCPRCLGSA